MVDRQQASLDLVFQALADPTRRRILRALARGDYRVSDLAKPHTMSLAAVSKHIQVLDRAGLIVRRREGKAQYIQLRTGPLQKATSWLSFYQKFWSSQLESLEELLTPKGRR